MRRLVVVLSVLLAALACPRPQPDAPLPPTTGSRKSDAGPALGPGPAAVKLEDKRKDKLAGLSVERREDGPWTVRRTTTGSGSRPGMEGAATGAMPPTDSFGAGGPPPERSFKAGAAEAEARVVEEAAPRMEAPAEPPPSPTPGPAHGRARKLALMPSMPAPQASPLKAGSTDDNAEFDAFLKFLAEWSDRPDSAQHVQLLDVRDRRFIEVVNNDGRPVPGAEIDVYDAKTERPLFSGTTYGDGRVPFYPRVVDPRGEAAEWLVNVRVAGATKSEIWRKDGALFRLAVDLDEPVLKPVPLDVLFLIDTTGSMSDEIQRIKETLLSVTKKLRAARSDSAAARDFDLRYAAVLYKDIGDEYVTRTHPFTSDIEAFDQALQSVTAGGGGDGPESLNQGLAEAVHGVKWRDRAAKVAFLIADADPHMDYDDDVPYGESAKDAVARGIRVHAVAASGLPPFGTLAFRQIAQYTRGKFIFIEYGSVAASAASHGVTGEVKSNNLDDIVLEQIQHELASWGRAGDDR